MNWHIKGEYFENCNCQILCPCLTSSMQGPGDGDNGRCQVPMIVHISDGAFDNVSLNGVKFVMMIDAPAVMAEGNWRTALYIDCAVYMQGIYRSFPLIRMRCPERQPSTTLIWMISFSKYPRNMTLCIAMSALGLRSGI